jgi:hypoxanthine phosphoribosyltransferase
MTVAMNEPQAGRTICTKEEIARAIEHLAASIAADYRRQPLLLLGVLKGALCFTADLARSLARQADGPSEIMVEYVFVERYGILGTTGAEPRLSADFNVPIRGANVLIVDDIADNGRTLAFLQAFLKERRAASVRSCVLFDRPARREVDVAIEYAGLAVPDVFAIGYGLDYKELYRNLPYLAELREGKTV